VAACEAMVKLEKIPAGAVETIKAKAAIKRCPD